MLYGKTLLPRFQVVIEKHPRFPFEGTYLAFAPRSAQKNLGSSISDAFHFTKHLSAAVRHVIPPLAGVHALVLRPGERADPAIQKID